jgi:benzoyl-CoA 2,3-epoxidase subunit B
MPSTRASRGASRRPRSRTLEHSTYPVLKFVDGEIKRVDEPALTAVNMRLRDDYTADCQRGLDRWNKVIAKVGVPYKFELPHVGFHRQIGEFKDVKISPVGDVVDDAAWSRDVGRWLPSRDDGDFIASLMRAVSTPGEFAGWIAPPRIGIDNKPGDFEYVKIAA